MLTTSTPNLTPLAVGQFRFNVVGELGKGGLGRVDRVRVISSNAPEKPVGTEWARKRLGEQWLAHPAARERFEREIVTLKSMEHLNIITYEGENLPGGERFYIMPVFARNVRRHIASGSQRGDWRSIAAYGAILADALHYAHSCGFIHRDFKPDNILFNANGPLVIADWGIGYFVHRDSLVLQQLTVGGMGTEYYCSVEQWATGKCDCRGDIYSLAMTLDEWVTGSQRFISVGDGIASDSTNDRSPGASDFNRILRAMASRAKTNRPPTMAEVADGLRAAAARQRP